MSLALAVLALFGSALCAWIALAPLTRRRPLEARLGGALALAPVLCGVLVAGLRFAGLHGGAALGLVIALAPVLASVPGLPRARARRGAPAPGSDAAAYDDAAPGATRAALALALVAGLLVAAVLASSEWWRLASDAWTHAPIVRVVRDGPLPPLDPWYAGFPLHYPWIYHVFVAAVVSLSGASTFDVMALLCVEAVVATALAAAWAARALHGRGAAGTVAFLFLGLNAAFPVLALGLLVRAWTHGGLAALLLAPATAPGPWTLERAETLFRAFGGQTWFLNKFMGVTPLALGLALYAAWLGELASAARGRDADAGAWKPALRAALWTAGAGLLHPVLALVLPVATAIALALVRGARRVRAFALGAFAGAAPALAYAAWVAGARDPGQPAPLDLSPQRVAGLASCLLLGLLFLPAAWRGLDRAARGAWFAWLAGAGALVLVLRLPGAWPFFTVDKTSYLAWLPLAITVGPACGAMLARLGRVRGTALAVLLFVPVNAALYGAFWTDPARAIRQPWNRPSLAALRAALPRDALLVAPPGDVDASVFLGRDLDAAERFDATVRGLPGAEIRARWADADTLFMTGRLTDRARARFESSRRPVFALWPDVAGQPWMGRTPGARARRMAPAGLEPPWAAALAVATADGDFALSPLNAAARGAWPAVRRVARLQPMAGQQNGGAPSGRSPAQF